MNELGIEAREGIGQPVLGERAGDFGQPTGTAGQSRDVRQVDHGGSPSNHKRDEMQGNEPRREIEHLAHTAASRKVTLLCTCREDVQCHRSLLRDLVEAQMTAVP